MNILSLHAWQDVSLATASNGQRKRDQSQLFLYTRHGRESLELTNELLRVFLSSCCSATVSQAVGEEPTSRHMEMAQKAKELRYQSSRGSP